MKNHKIIALGLILSVMSCAKAQVKNDALSLPLPGIVAMPQSTNAVRHPTQDKDLQNIRISEDSSQREGRESAVSKAPLATQVPDQAEDKESAKMQTVTISKAKEKTEAPALTSSVVRQAQKEVGGWARDFSSRPKAELVDALMQREATLKRNEELYQAREKIAMTAFAISTVLSGKISEERFWDIAPAPHTSLKGKRSILFLDGSSLKFSETSEKTIALQFENLSTNGCRVLTEALIEQVLDESARTNPFRKSELLSLQFGMNILPRASFAQAKLRLVPTDGVAQQWLAAKENQASNAVIKVLSQRDLDPCESMRVGDVLLMKWTKSKDFKER